jgi:hypothetical protein
VRRLDPDNQALVLQGHLDGRFDLHVPQVVFKPAASHAVADDVQESQDARLGPVYDAALEILEVAPAGAARVGHRGHADSKRESIRMHAIVAGAGIALAGTGVDVGVDIDHAGRHVQAGNIHGAPRARWRDVRFDSRDLAVRDGHVAQRVDLVLRVDDPSTFEEHIAIPFGRRPPPLQAEAGGLSCGPFYLRGPRCKRRNGSEGVGFELAEGERSLSAGQRKQTVLSFR